MPILKHKGVCDSARVLLGGDYYGHYFSHNLIRRGGDTIVQRYIRSLTESFRGADDHAKNLSAIGTLYHYIFTPPAPNISDKFHHHKVEINARSSRDSSPEISKALFSSLHPGTKRGTNFAGGFSQKYRLASHVDIGFPCRFKGITQVSQLVACLDSMQHRGSTMFYRSYWLDSGMLCNSTSDVDSGSKTFHSSSFSQQPVGAAHDISFDGVVREEQHENSAASSGQTALADRTLKLVSGSCYLPHPDKEETGGEDAHFISEEGQAIGVADGVGGWADLGVNAGEYARELMSNSLNAIQEEPRGAIDPSRVLEKAYLCTTARGSSTACIIALTDQGVHAVNLGDSGFIVVRDGCTVFRSPVQQHDFNFTYQLESEHGSDLPSSAQVFKVSVDPGDVIIAGTDGLFDNLYNNEVTAVVVHAIRAGLGPQVTAQKIAALARQRAQDKNRQTPFSSAAQDAGYRYYGGKLDDITVVVSVISASNS